jgi:hypothetical protein
VSDWQPERETIKLRDVCVVMEKSHRSPKSEPYLVGVFDTEAHALYECVKQSTTTDATFSTVPLWTVRIKPWQMCNLAHDKGVKCPNEEKGCSW